MVDTQRRRQMSIAAREGAWKFERNVILQQMAENYKDAIVKHRDPAFLKEHLKQPEAAGRNCLSFICCDYYFVRQIAEPFLASSRQVQDLVDSTQQCVESSRTHLSCEALLKLGQDAERGQSEDDEEAGGSSGMGGLGGRADGAKGKKTAGLLSRMAAYCPTGMQEWMNKVVNSNGSAPSGASRFMSLFALMVFITVAMMFIYASFSV